MRTGDVLGVIAIITAISVLVASLKSKQDIELVADDVLLSIGIANVGTWLINESPVSFPTFGISCIIGAGILRLSAHVVAYMRNKNFVEIVRSHEHDN